VPRERDNKSSQVKSSTRPISLLLAGRPGTPIWQPTVMPAAALMSLIATTASSTSGMALQPPLITATAETLVGTRSASAEAQQPEVQGRDPGRPIAVVAEMMPGVCMSGTAELPKLGDLHLMPDEMYTDDSFCGGKLVSPRVRGGPRPCRAHLHTFRHTLAHYRLPFGHCRQAESMCPKSSARA
jgi:hypothetical protein